MRHLLPALQRIHDALRDEILDRCDALETEAAAAVAFDGPGDTIYSLDRAGEERLIELFEREIASIEPVVLVAEGLDPGGVVLPVGADRARARWRVLVDPIDGTRGLMYQKRSAWILTGIAPERGEATDLHDIALAVQTEIPTLRQHLCDRLWAIAGEGAGAERLDRTRGTTSPLRLRPSRATTVEHGFATVCRYFPGASEELARFERELILRIAGPAAAGKATCFEDQYISSAGQLYEVVAGHDRLVADLRPLFGGGAHGLCAHPYDLSTELIARELGVVVTDPAGERLRAPADLEAEIAWIAYANPSLQADVGPHISSLLKELGLL